MDTLATIIVLNGPSSAGKTSLSKLLQEQLPEPYLHIGIDKIIDMMPAKLNDWVGNPVKQGFWWKIEKDQKGHRMAHIQCGPYAEKIGQTLKDFVVTAAQNGHNVIVDEVCLSKNEWAVWHKKLQPFNVLWVGVTAPAETLEEREQLRGNRMLGSARAQHKSVHQGKSYNVEIDTSQSSLQACIHKIIAALKPRENLINGHT